MPHGAAAPSSGQRLSAAQRGDEAVRLRVKGWTLDEIATELGYKGGRSAVSKAVTAAIKRQGKPAAEELAAIHMERLEVAARQIMTKLSRDSGKLTTSALGRATLSLTRVLAAEARYVDVYSQGQGLGPVVSLLETLLSSPPPGVDPDDPMTVPTNDTE